MKRRNMIKTLLAALLVCASVSFAGDVLKGSEKSKIYHNSTCRHYTAKGSTVEFQSEQEAEDAGYKACKQCSKEKGEKVEKEEVKTEKDK